MSESDKIKAQLVIVTGLLVLYFIFETEYLLYAAAFVGVVSIAIPVILGAINGKILLSVVFFVILFPVAVISRLGKKNILALKRESRKTVFVERNHKYTGKDLEQVW
jgi:hypothetical protein